MGQIKKLLARLSMAQKISIAGAAMLAAAALIGLTQWRHEGDFRPLYTGLAPEDAGAVVQKLRRPAPSTGFLKAGRRFWRLRLSWPNCACNWPPAACRKAVAWVLNCS